MNIQKLLNDFMTLVGKGEIEIIMCLVCSMNLGFFCAQI